MIKFTIKLGLLLVVLTGVVNASAQDEKGEIELNFSTFGENDVFSSTEPPGAPSFSGDKHYSIGLLYRHPISGMVDFETGLEYSCNKIIKHPNVDPRVDISSKSENLTMLTIPATIRFSFLKYLFFRGGALLDIDTSMSSVDSQTGIGALIEIGMKYEFNSGLGLSLSPYNKMHSLIPFSSGDYPQHLIENGIQFGISYQL